MRRLTHRRNAGGISPFASTPLVLSQSPYGGHWLTFSEDGVIGRSLRRTGVFEESSIATAIALLQTIGVNIRREIFVDVGANIGTHTVFAIKEAGFEKAVCFEPDPHNLALLYLNQALHGIERNCINVACGLSNREAFLHLAKSATNLGDHRIVLDGENGPVTSTLPEDQKAVVPVMTFDRWLEKSDTNPGRIGLVWCDTQGHESHVLAGATAIFQHRIPVIIEFWPYGLKQVNGYSLLRQQFKAAGAIYDLRTFSQRATTPPVPLSVLDRLYEVFLQSERPEVSKHIDLLIVP